jgi:hypothetical protein
MTITTLTRETLSALIGEWVAPVARSHGFVQKQKRFSRRESDDRLTNLLEVHTQTYSQDNTIRFALEWSIYVAGYPTAAWGSESQAPAVKSSPFIANVGGLSDDGRDRWWEVTQDAVAEWFPVYRSVARSDRQLSDLLEQRLMPIADRDWTADLLVAFLENDETQHMLRWNDGLPGRPRPRVLVRDLLSSG